MLMRWKSWIVQSIHLFFSVSLSVSVFLSHTLSFSDSLSLSHTLAYYLSLSLSLSVRYIPLFSYIINTRSLYNNLYYPEISMKEIEDEKKRERWSVSRIQPPSSTRYWFVLCALCNLYMYCVYMQDVSIYICRYLVYIKVKEEHGVSIFTIGVYLICTYSL